ncbi:hypothetical protein EYZ11_012678 [Aspergillus tanneri]|uniref:Uncharacterized protein n=1 Tax=Aspergillus tanneri TaxID=1220188 RepID=A0A4S3IZV6_9EURO|nr:hypothetical protein EYZ11_012678 [Aspergillus tanneri]
MITTRKRQTRYLATMELDAKDDWQEAPNYYWERVKPARNRTRGIPPSSMKPGTKGSTPLATQVATQWGGKRDRAF